MPPRTARPPPPSGNFEPIQPSITPLAPVDNSHYSSDNPPPPSQPAPQDPFYIVKDKIQATLLQLRGDLTTFEEQLRSSTPMDDIDVRVSKARQDVASIDVDIKDLAQTISIVEQHRESFPTIDDRELNSRRSFVRDSLSSLTQASDQVERLAIKAQAVQRKQLMTSRSGAATAAVTAASAAAGDSLVRGTMAQQQQLIEAQDVELDSIEASLDRLMVISDDINKELIIHEKELNELDSQIDIARDGLQSAVKKMYKLLKSSDNGKLCLLLVLVAACCALFFGIVYM